MKKFIAVFLSILMVFTMGISAFAAETDYAISNPYGEVDWDAYNAYKADLHSHTNASDGDNTTVEMAERHYELGFDIYAQSDHGTTNYSWTEKDSYDPTIKLFMMVKEGISPIVTLDKNGTAANGKYFGTSEGHLSFASAKGTNNMDATISWMECAISVWLELGKDSPRETVAYMYSDEEKARIQEFNEAVIPYSESGFKHNKEGVPGRGFIVANNVYQARKTCAVNHRLDNT